MEYPGLHMLRFIRIERHEPLSILKTYKALSDILVSEQIPTRCRKYYWVGCDRDPYTLWGLSEYSRQLITDGMPMALPYNWKGKPFWEATLAICESRPDF